MNNAEKFKQIFGLYAIELWSMPGGDFLEWLDRDVETTQIDHTADISKKVSIPCAHENDVIFREMAIEALARMMPRSYTPDGSHPADEEIFMAQEVFADCIEALEILPSAQPEIIRCKDCKYNVSSRKCLQPDSFFLVTSDDFYCGYAKRRTDEDIRGEQDE